MNICFEWMILTKWTIFLNKYSRFSLPASKVVDEKCFTLISNHSVGPFKSISGVFDPYRGLWRALKPYFGLLLEFWIIFLKFFWMNNSFKYSVLYWLNIFWINISDFVLNWILNWIIFRPDSMKKWIFKTYRTGLPWDHESKWWNLQTFLGQFVLVINA